MHIVIVSTVKLSDDEIESEECVSNSDSSSSASSSDEKTPETSTIKLSQLNIVSEESEKEKGIDKEDTEIFKKESSSEIDLKTEKEKKLKNSIRTQDKQLKDKSVSKKDSKPSKKGSKEDKIQKELYEKGGISASESAVRHFTNVDSNISQQILEIGIKLQESKEIFRNKESKVMSEVLSRISANKLRSKKPTNLEIDQNEIKENIKRLLQPKKEKEKEKEKEKKRLTKAFKVDSKFRKNKMPENDHEYLLSICRNSMTHFRSNAQLLPNAFMADGRSLKP
ncbi:hypothetical protein C0J52_11867 [Blattella germanica]|nr:hypothetical protein C0J52_11867 [Blattella germanica]